jgi:DNA polymerase III epsilon subunit-like protein
MRELMVALDLELNQLSRRVVQIGAVLGNVRTGEVVSQFDLKVNPGEPFSLRIAELTGISSQEIESAPVLLRPDRHCAVRSPDGFIDPCWLRGTHRADHSRQCGIRFPRNSW